MADRNSSRSNRGRRSRSGVKLRARNVRLGQLRWTESPWLEFTHTTVAPENFRLMRRHVLRLSQAECGELLRVDRTTVQRWEAGSTPVPFMAYHLLRLISENRNFMFTHPEWRGWGINTKGKFYDPTSTMEFTPPQLEAAWVAFQQAAHFERLFREATAKLNALVEENTRLRELFVSQGVVREIAAMQDRLRQIFSSLNTAEVIPLLPNPSTDERTLPCAASK